MVHRTIGVLLILLLLAACVLEPAAPVPTATPTLAPTPTAICAVEAADFLVQYDLIIARWEDAIDLAGSTARLSLPGPVAELQAVRREMAELGGDLPPCALRVRLTTVAYMDHIIEGTLLFMADEPRPTVSAELDAAADMREEMWAALAAIDAEAAQATRQARPTPAGD